VTSARLDDCRLRVLTLTRDVGTGLGGAEKIAFEFARRLDRERFKPYLCLTRAPEPTYAAATARDVALLEADGVEVLRLERRSTLSLPPWARLYKLLVRESIDVLHAHMPRAGVPGTIIARQARVPVVVNHEHGWSYVGKRVRRFLDRNVIARGSDVLLAVSEWDRQNIIETEHIPAELVRVLPNGISPRPRTDADVRGELGVGREVGLIGAIGRLFPEKGYDDLLRALALLKQGQRPVRCVIAGQGPAEADLRELARELDVADTVQFLGHRNDVADVIGALDVAVLSSKHEGSPLAVIEYMAAGAPIVATAVGGVPELVQDDVHALLVEPGDPAALMSAIARMLDDRPLALRLGAAARERQHECYDLDAVVTRLQDLYLELYERSRSARTARAYV
jgi:glycosyltransferase involved in cell wall biosynthesis